MKLPGELIKPKLTRVEAPIHGSRGSPPRHAPIQARGTEHQRRLPRHHQDHSAVQTQPKPVFDNHYAAARVSDTPIDILRINADDRIADAVDGQVGICQGE